MRLAIVSQSARIYAEMARREGFEVLAVDAFADTDTRLAAHEVWQLPNLCRRLTAEDVSTLLSKLDVWQPEFVLVGSGFEADIEGYETLYQRFRVLGNLPSVIRQVKNPHWLQTYLTANGIRSPEITDQIPREGDWLYKQAGQCGGSHIQDWQAEVSATENGYWQAFQAGQAIGALFVVSRQKVTLIGVHALKKRPGTYTYAGASRVHDHQLIEAMQSLLETLVTDLGLVGINSLDAIWFDNELHVLEINPRLSASMRLYTELPLIQAHIDSCQGKAIPALQLNNARASHCIFYARQEIEVEQLNPPDWVEDRPGHGTIAAGQPLCSLYAEGRSSREVQQILQDKKTQLEKLWGTYVCEHIEFNIH